MLVVGLTGGIASGKSTVSHLLASQHHVPLIDLDTLAREVVRPSDASRTLQKLVARFGDRILLPDGSLDRPALGRIAFGDEEKRRALNAITHGAIRRRMAWLLVKYWLAGQRFVVVDTPLLVEAGLWKWCGEMVLVWCSPEDQLERMLSRDASKGLTRSDAETRLGAQLPLRSKLAYADVVLDNSESHGDAAAGQGAEAQTSATATTTTTTAAVGAAGAASPALRAQVAALVQRWRAETGGALGTARWLASWLLPPVGVVLGAVAVWRRGNVVARRRKEEGEHVRIEEVLARRGVQREGRKGKDA